jgi:chlorite dismutase
MMAEHGMLGRSYGDAGLAQDIRLKCFGLDRNDNEFLIGLVGADLNPLSRLVEDMRGTRQTAEYMDNLGPFFVGHRIGAVNVVNAW